MSNVETEIDPVREEIMNRIARAHVCAASSRRMTYVWLAFALAALTLLTVSYIFAQRGVGAQELRDLQRRQNQGIACLLDQQNQHRLNSYQIAAEAAHKQGIVLTIPKPPAKLEFFMPPEESCAPFIKEK